MAASSARVRASSSRASIAMIPCPTAGRNSSVDRIDGGSVGEPQPLQPGEREQGGVDLAGIELAQARLHIAAEVHDREIGTQPLDQRLPAQRRGADHSAVRKVLQGAARCG